jgi:hypothetical protein
VWDTLGETKGTLGLSDDWYRVQFEGWEIYSRVPEINDALDFEGVIKSRMKDAVATVANPIGLTEALSRARVLADAESKKTDVSIVKGKMHLLTSTHMGDVADTLLFKDHPDVNASISAAHLQQALDYCDQMAVLENCIVLEKAPDVLMLVSNL